MKDILNDIKKTDIVIIIDDLNAKVEINNTKMMIDMKYEMKQVNENSKLFRN
jgi:hypothetical protein